MAGLTDDFGRHPEDGALETSTISGGAEGRGGVCGGVREGGWVGEI